MLNFDRLDPNTALNRIVRELKPRPAGGGDGIDLIAEPWGIGGNSYQVGGFPTGWSEWNNHYRDAIRVAQNRCGAGLRRDAGDTLFGVVRPVSEQ
jgi:glycogen operon protein